MKNVNRQLTIPAYMQEILDELKKMNKNLEKHNKDANNKQTAKEGKESKTTE